MRFWKLMDNRRNITDEIAKKLNIRDPRDWGRITRLQIHELGGGSLLTQYDGSPFKLLASVYKG